MRLIGVLLTKMMLLRFLVILFGITAFVLTLDLIAYSDEILNLNNEDAMAIARYAFLRTPDVMAQFVTISVLLAALLMLTEISRHSELVAIWSSGMSQFRVMVTLLPLATALGLGHFLLVDRAIPAAAPILNDWGIGDHSEKKLNIGKDDPMWMRAGNDILRAARSNDEATRLENVIIFRRDKDGILSEQITAETARLQDGRWIMTNIGIFYRNNEPPVRIPSMVYSGPLKPAATGTRSGDPVEMSLRTLSYFITNAGFGIRPTHVYETWRHKRLSTLVTSALMLMIAIPLAGRFQRGGGLGLMFAFGIAMGFGFFIFDGISLTMGELGILPPWFAAWTPVLVFATAAGAIAFRRESL